MNNNLEAGSTKVQRSGNAFCARLTTDKVIVGLLSITLLLLSLIGAIVMVTGTHTTAAAATTSTKSVTKRTPNDTSTPTITTTTSTSTPSPSPTSTSTPSPTPTATTKMTPTSSSTSTPLATKTTSPTPTAFASTTTTAGATGTVSAAVTQSSGQGQTPTTSSNSNDIQSTAQDQQDTGFPFIAIIIGLLASVAVIFVLLIGWWLLRKRLLPMRKVKLPPSGTGPWSRVRTGETAWDVNANDGFQPGDNNDWVSNNTASWGYNGVTATMGHAPENGWPAPNDSSFAPSNVSFTSPYYGVPPATHGFVQANANYDFASSTDQFAPGNGAFPFNPGSLNRVHNAPGMPGPGDPDATRLQAMNNNGHEANVYEQWLRNSAVGTPDLNDPYLKELIRQYSDKSRALQRQQKMERQG